MYFLELDENKIDYNKASRALELQMLENLLKN